MQDVMSLDGKTIVVTGAAQGIGRAIANLAIALGARVAGVDLNGDKLDAFAATTNGRLLPYVGNVADPEFTEATVRDIMARIGAIDGLVNNAGIIRPAMIEKMTLQQWSEVISVHLTGAFLWTQAVGRVMVAQGKAGRESVGSIVNISSDAGRAGSIGQINYAAAKSGLLGMTMTAAKEWSKFGVRTNSVCFGVVETPMTETIRGDKFRDGMLARIRWGVGPRRRKRSSLCASCSRMPRPISPASTLPWTAAITSPSNPLRRMIGSAGFRRAASATAMAVPRGNCYSCRGRTHLPLPEDGPSRGQPERREKPAAG